MKKISVLVLAGLILLSCLVGCADESGLTPNDPVLSSYHMISTRLKLRSVKCFFSSSSTSSREP